MHYFNFISGTLPITDLLKKGHIVSCFLSHEKPVNMNYEYQISQ